MLCFVLIFLVAQAAQTVQTAQTAQASVEVAKFVRTCLEAGRQVRLLLRLTEASMACGLILLLAHTHSHTERPIICSIHSPSGAACSVATNALYLATDAYIRVQWTRQSQLSTLQLADLMASPFDPQRADQNGAMPQRNSQGIIRQGAEMALQQGSATIQQSETEVQLGARAGEPIKAQAAAEAIVRLMGPYFQHRGIPQGQMASLMMTWMSADAAGVPQLQARLKELQTMWANVAECDVAASEWCIRYVRLRMSAGAGERSPGPIPVCDNGQQVVRWMAMEAMRMSAHRSVVPLLALALVYANTLDVIDGKLVHAFRVALTHQLSPGHADWLRRLLHVIKD